MLILLDLNMVAGMPIKKRRRERKEKERRREKSFQHL